MEYDIDELIANSTQAPDRLSTEKQMEMEGGAASRIGQPDGRKGLL